MELKITTPKNFSFRRTVASHGWYGLLPFTLDAEKWQLTRVIDVGKKPPVTIVLTGRKNHVHINTSRPLNKAEVAIVLRDARHILRLDDDLQNFYLATGNDPEFAWIGEQGACVTELTFLARRDITAAPVASSIVHEGMHARVDRMGVSRYSRDRAREERLCRRAELEFGQSLPPELGAPVIQRAIESLALADKDVAPAIDWSEALRRQNEIDRNAKR